MTARHGSRGASAANRGAALGRLRRSRWAVLVGVGALAVTAACGGDEGGGDGGGTTITFANWASAEETTGPGFKKLIAAFEAENPGVTVESQAISFEEIGHQLVLRTQSGDPPDVAQISGGYTADVAETGALAPLDEYMSDSLRSQMDPANLEAGVFNDEFVAFPWTGSPQGFWYNKKLMQQAGLDPNQPPTTIGELMDQLAAIKREFPDVIGLGLDVTNRSFGLDSNWSWMQTFGVEPFSGTEANADTPEMQQYLEWMRQMAEQDYIQPGPKIGDFRPMAAQNEVAFMWDQNLMQGVVQDEAGMSDKEFYDTWGVSSIPVGPAGEESAVQLGHQLIMFNQAEDKEAAWKLIEFLATSEQAVTEYTIPVGASFPPHAEPEAEVAQMLDTPVNDVFYDEIMPDLVTPPYGPEYNQAWEPIMVGIQQTVTGGEPIDDITNSMHSSLESSLG